MTSVRRAAAEVLLAISRGRERGSRGSPLNTTLAAEVERARSPFTDRRDRALLVELTVGALRWRNALDAVIGAASRRRIENIDERARAVLRIGVYQLRYLTRVPAHAVVHESVETIRQLGAPRAAPFVNAVLRAVTRGGGSLDLPRRPHDDAARDRWIAYLTISVSHPAWLVERWLERYGAVNTEAWCLFNNRTPDVVIRPLPGFESSQLVESLRSRGLDAAPARYVTDAVRLAPGTVGRLDAPDLERIHIQDEGSQLVARAVAVRPDERVLDLCASPGGKTLVMATDLGVQTAVTGAPLVAADHRAARVRLLAQTLRRARLDVPIVRLDARESLPFGAVFDAVVVDAPCSGLGTVSRDPDLKWSRTPDQLAGFARDQVRMLRAAADSVCPGGRLVYATCSSEPEENAGVVDAFLATDGRFVLEPLSSPAVPASMVDAQGCLTTLPFRDGIDAFFAARLVRRKAA
jgi:16S rRNA (cytosine967-C5)-methyltransferase